MATFHNTLPLLPLFESPSNLFVLMEQFEEFINLCHSNQIQFWIDWGTELGSLRHSNIIPWDIDCDTCLTEENYEKLLRLFESHNGTIGNLTCDPNGYNDPHGCCWVFSKKNLHMGKDFFGIDCVSYKVGENETKTLMSQATVDNCPAAPSSYDYSNSELFPLKSILFVGNYVLTPNKSIALMKRFYGDETYLKYPHQEYNQWLEYNSNKLFLLNCPFKTLPEVQWLADGFKLSTPFVIRNPTEFHVDIQKLTDIFTKENQVSSWFETKEDIFTEEISTSSNNLMKKWEHDELVTNITDSPLSHYEFLPKFLLDRMDKLAESYRPFALSYVLTNKNTLTKFHVDIGGGGWIYLKQGQKLWWFISPEDIAEVEKNGYPIEKLRELSFTELVFLHDHYLWGKIYVLLLDKNDFVYFPEHWAHRVFTYDKAFGISGYSR